MLLEIITDWNLTDIWRTFIKIHTAIYEDQWSIINHQTADAMKYVVKYTNVTVYAMCNLTPMLPIGIILYLYELTFNTINL